MVLILSIFATGLGLGLRNRWCQLGVAVIFSRHISIIMYFNYFPKLFSRSSPTLLPWQSFTIFSKL